MQSLIHNIDTHLHEIINFICLHLDYKWVFITMFLESTFVPIPSELIIPPAGYNAYVGSMNIGWVIIDGTIGSICGAMFNYYLAVWLGRPFLHKYGKYMLIRESTLVKVENFFERHGAISTFSGRLIIGVRHFISLPAGLAQMHKGKFIFYTAAGAWIWVSILSLLGYEVGKNEVLITQYLHHIVLGMLVAVIVMVAIYCGYHWRKKI